MSPLPGTSSVHPDWSAHHAPVPDHSLTGLLTIRSPETGGGWDPIDGPSAGSPGDLLHEGPFWAQSLSDAANLEAAGQPVRIQRYRIRLSSGTGSFPGGSVIRVQECPDDAELEGKRLTVLWSDLVSRRFERTLYAELDHGNQED